MSGLLREFVCGFVKGAIVSPVTTPGQLLLVPHTSELAGDMREDIRYGQPIFRLPLSA